MTQAMPGCGEVRETRAVFPQEVTFEQTVIFIQDPGKSWVTLENPFTSL